MNYSSSKAQEELLLRMEAVINLKDPADYNKAKAVIQKECELWGLPTTVRAYHMLIVAGLSPKGPECLY